VLAVFCTFDSALSPWNRFLAYTQLEPGIPAFPKVFSESVLGSRIIAAFGSLTASVFSSSKGGVSKGSGGSSWPRDDRRIAGQGPGWRAMNGSSATQLTDFETQLDDWKGRVHWLKADKDLQLQAT
jgi:hypothetical protein